MLRLRLMLRSRSSCESYALRSWLGGLGEVRQPWQLQFQGGGKQAKRAASPQPIELDSDVEIETGNESGAQPEQPPAVFLHCDENTVDALVVQIIPKKYSWNDAFKGKAPLRRYLVKKGTLLGEIRKHIATARKINVNYVCLFNAPEELEPDFAIEEDLVLELVVDMRKFWENNADQHRQTRVSSKARSRTPSRAQASDSKQRDVGGSSASSREQRGRRQVRGGTVSPAQPFVANAEAGETHVHGISDASRSWCDVATQTDDALGPNG